MKLTKCSNNHFYDGDKYSECPHCSRAASTGQVGANTEASSVHPVSHKTSSKRQTSQGASQTSSMWEKSHRGSIGKTESVISGLKETVLPTSQASAELPQEQLVSPTPVDAENNTPLEVGSLQEAVNVVKSPISTEDTKTMAFYNIAAVEPVVGWLVCVKGEYLGESFNLKTGRNMIGRSLKMDVPLAKEPSVSRDRHAIITYEPKKRRFFIQPGEGNGLTYVNDDLLMVPCELKNYDKVQLGNSEFVFCALCGESFTWDDYVEVN